MTMKPHTHFVLAVIVTGLLTAAPVPSACAQDFSVLNGEWVRHDGGYVLQVDKARADGSVHVAYFNPRPIYVAEAFVSIWKDYQKLFVKLQDKGYPGSTYTLFYFKDKDALAGFYHQAQTGQTFEVVFVRRKPNH